jgi:Protein of unknown function (DUF1194)
MATHHLLSSACAIALLSTPQLAAANTLELALVIDGSGSISSGDWALQTGAYQSIFQDSFFTNFIQPSPFDDIVVGAFVFSGGTIRDQDDNPIETFAVSSIVEWALINDDADAFSFGAQLGALMQPGGQTNTSAAIDIATNGGTVGCLIGSICNVSPSGTRPGLLNNGFNGDKLVIDISTDGVPTLPNANGNPNIPEAEIDRALAIAAADAARAAGITVNAIGVGNLDATFLAALVGEDPAATPGGFFLTASSFDQFDEALREKAGRETFVPVTPALALFITVFGSALFWCRKRV